MVAKDLDGFAEDLRARKVDVAYAKAVPTFGLDEMRGSRNDKKVFTRLAYRNSNFDALAVLHERKIATKVRKPPVEWIYKDPEKGFSGGKYGAPRGHRVTIVSEEMAIHILEANPEFVEKFKAGSTEIMHAYLLTCMSDDAKRIREDSIRNGYLNLYKKFFEPTPDDLKLAVGFKAWELARYLFDALVPAPGTEERPVKRVRFIE